MAQNLSFAIQWLNVETPLGRKAYIDLDSITEYKSYYFYNIKFKNKENGDFVIMTMQSSKHSPMSARVKAYTEEEYKLLDGDYNNITNNIKTELEPVTYQSVVNTCYKKVKHIKEMQSAETIILEKNEEF